MKKELRTAALEWLKASKLISNIIALYKSLTTDMSVAKIKKSLGITYLAGINSSSKIEKGEKLNYDTLILYLSASTNAGFDLCKHASEFCRQLCLVASGRASMDKKAGYKETGIYVSRLIKTWLYRYNKPVFFKVLESEVSKLIGRNNVAVRLNGTSDLNFKKIIKKYSSIQFYDYTKDINRALKNTLKNYHITFSFSGDNHFKCLEALCNGINVAVPVSEATKQALLKDYSDDCIDGDITDLRFLDEIKGGLVLLTVKGNDIQQNDFIASYNTCKKLIEEC